jgi:pseudaminic acid cytidylyltransferase
VVEHDGPVEYFCCLYATAMLVQPAHLRAAYEILVREKARTVVSVAQFSFPLQRALHYNEQGRLEFLHPEHRYTRSQDLPARYQDAGMFYFGQAAAFLDEGYFHSSDSIGYEMPSWAIQDVDSEEDWQLAEVKYRVLRELGRL